MSKRRALGGLTAIAVVAAVIASPAATSADAEGMGACRGGTGASAKPNRADTINMTETTRSAGLWDPLLGMFAHATAAGDVNGDGWTDLFVGRMAATDDPQFRGASEKPPDRLLLGGPEGFTVDETFPATYGVTSGAVFADLDNDGDLDLVTTRNQTPTADPSEQPETFRPESLILRNDGGQFTIAQSFVLEGARAPVVLDYDGDGRLDLFVAADRYLAPGTSRLYRNVGVPATVDMWFVDVTEAALLPTNVHAFAAGSADLNGDGWQDLFVPGNQRSIAAVDGEEQVSQAARMFVNNADGTFREVDGSEFNYTTFWAERAGQGDGFGGVAFADLNRDGRQDIVMGEHAGGGGGGWSPLLIRGIPAVFIYLNKGVDDNGDPKFEDVTTAAGIPLVHSRSPHVEIVDYDADGWPDIVAGITRGDGTELTIFRHLGVDGDVPRFADPGGLVGDERETPPENSSWEDFMQMPRYWPTGASADYDRDGRMDTFVVEWFPELPSRLFRNETKAGNWLFVDVLPQSEGIGAEVEIFCNGRLGDPQALLGAREVTVSVSYAAGIPSEIYFGLRNAKKVDVRVTLPHGGGTVELRDVDANQHVVVPANDAL